MITCHRKHLEQRCLARGYDMDAVRGCIVSEKGDFLVVDEYHSDYPVDRNKAYPGRELKKLLSRVGITTTPNCSCIARAKAMDKRGVEWCEQNVETICDWLQEEATKRKLPFVRLAGKAIIHLAIKRAKKNTSK